jgi:sugar/nucleoside kinase (ribokinase family)
VLSVAFKYLTPKIRLDHNSLTPSCLLAKSFHLICGPARCIELVTGITSLRDKINTDSPRPIFIWEPTPDTCIPEHLDDCLEASTYVDIVSPNHLELGAFFNPNATHAPNGEVDEGLMEELSDRFLKSGVGPDTTGCVVVRCGKRGCFMAHPDIPTQDRWLPAFHTPSATGEESGNVVDPTGGGNAFLGGLSIGMVRLASMTGGDRLKEAVIWGTVAASFAVEQVGVPVLGEGEQGETWNGVHIGERIAEYKRRIRGQ